jgi:drug/metabolite transporter (DMT)-like permease
MEIVLSLVSALLFALGTVLQQKAGVDEPSAGAHAGLILRMATQRVWLAGIVFDGLGFVAQAAALGSGHLAVVQPLLVFSVVFALPLGIRISHQSLHRDEVVAAVAVVVGLVVFLSLARPSGGRSEAPLSDWLIPSAILAVVCAPLVILGRRGPAPRRAAWLGTAAGILFALTAALTKAVVDELGVGVVHVLSSWELYALIGIGYVSMTLNQMALNTGALAATIATSTASDPVVSVVLGLVVFDESLHVAGLGAIATAVALGVALVGMAVLARAEEQTGVLGLPASADADQAPVGSASAAE